MFKRTKEGNIYFDNTYTDNVITVKAKKTSFTKKKGINWGIYIKIYFEYFINLILKKYFSL